MNFVKNHWFSCLIAGMMLCFFCIFVLILLAPKQDAKGRGFIPCTQEMVQKLLDCDRKFFCSTKVVFDNNLCMLKVIGHGFSDWLNHKQPRPWSNYIFEPEIPLNTYIDEEARQNYLNENPDTSAEMQRLNLLRKELENEEANNSGIENLWNEE